MHGFSANVGHAFTKNYGVALSFDYAGTDNVEFAGFNPLVKTVFSYSAFSGYFEYRLWPKKLINFSFPLKAGLGYATYRQKVYFGGGYYNTVRNVPLARDFFFVAEPGVNVMINALKYISLKFGATYRLVAGADTLGDNDDFTGFTFNFGLRFKITDL